jgi:hypothetical protein
MIRRLVVTLLAVLVLVPVLAFAAEEAGAPPVEASLVALLSAIGVAVIPWVTWGVAKVVPKIPRAALPYVPVALGGVADYLIRLATGVDNPLGAAGIALGALVLRETINSLSQHGLQGGGGKVLASDEQPVVKRTW